MRSLLCSLLLFTLAIHPPEAGGQAGRYSGRTLQSVLEELRAAGAPLAYSSNLVSRRLRVESEPTSTEPLTLARELLAQHGLAIQETGNSWLVVRDPTATAPRALGGIALTVAAAGFVTGIDEAVAQLDAPTGPALALVAGRAVFRDVASGRHVVTVRATGFLPERVPVDVRPGATADVEVALAATAPPLEELTVTASRYDLRNELQPSTSYFSQEQIENLAELGDDALRVAHRLPGIATNEFSSRSHVRGGAADEMAVVLDGMKLFEPFHLRDYQSVFSTIDQRIVAGIEVYSGGFARADGPVAARARSEPAVHVLVVERHIRRRPQPMARFHA
jgi:hypothetical protein